MAVHWAALRPWLVRLEVALSALLSSTTTVKFNAAALVRTDLLTRYQAHESAIRIDATRRGVYPWLITLEGRSVHKGVPPTVTRPPSGARCPRPC